MIDTIKLKEEISFDYVEIIDQRLLPEELTFLKIETSNEMFDAIKTLAVRGAPALGIAGAYGLVISMQNSKDLSKTEFLLKLSEIGDYLKSSRPTAVNLEWAINDCYRVIQETKSDSLYGTLKDHALKIHQDDLEMSTEIGALYKQIFPKKSPVNILTICNAGGLATGGLGTALAPIFAACDDGIKTNVYCLETRPLLQGARLTAWELNNYEKNTLDKNINVNLLCDNMISSLFDHKPIDLIITGADRIAINGDSANKIGTHNLAIIAQNFNIPFYVAAPSSTIDFNCLCGDDIPIEQRKSKELSHFNQRQIAPLDISFYNPAFDVTPAKYITGFLTDKGLINAKDIKNRLIS